MDFSLFFVLLVIYFICSAWREQSKLFHVHCKPALMCTQNQSEAVKTLLLIWSMNYTISNRLCRMLTATQTLSSGHHFYEVRVFSDSRHQSRSLTTSPSRARPPQSEQWRWVDLGLHSVAGALAAPAAEQLAVEYLTRGTPVLCGEHELCGQ